jgi:hypothetical protein
MSKQLFEAIKEPLRLMALALVSWLITEGVSALLKAIGGQLTPEMQLVVAGALVSLLRGLDKYLHEVGKENGDANLTKGLVRF